MDSWIWNLISNLSTNRSISSHNSQNPLFLFPLDFFFFCNVFPYVAYFPLDCSHFRISQKNFYTIGPSFQQTLKFESDIKHAGSLIIHRRMFIEAFLEKICRINNWRNLPITEPTPAPKIRVSRMATKPKKKNKKVPKFHLFIRFSFSLAPLATETWWQCTIRICGKPFVEEKNELAYT